MYHESGFYCQREKCPKSCCGAYSGFADRLNSVDGREFNAIVLTDEDAAEILNSEYRKYVYQSEDGLNYITTDAEGCCSVYQSGECLMGELKPTICKCYPLYLDVFVGLCSQKACSAVDSNYTLANYANEIEPVLKICEFWISYYRKQIESGK